MSAMGVKQQKMKVRDQCCGVCKCKHRTETSRVVHKAESPQTVSNYCNIIFLMLNNGTQKEYLRSFQNC